VVELAKAKTNGDGARPGVLSERESALRAHFLAEVEKIPGGDRLRRCIQCGTCSGSCPVSYAMDIQPRQIVAFFRAGDLESILNSRTIWVCASCYSCTVRCPAGIKVTDLIYGLKRMALDKQIYKRGAPVRQLSEQFIKMIERYGRNQELQLLMNYYLGRKPAAVVGTLPLGMRLFWNGRLPWRTERIKGLKGLRRIIAKAKAMDEAYPREPITEVGEIGYGAVAERTGTAGGGGS
jgi:heterodisulfide reductase subunit C